MLRRSDNILSNALLGTGDHGRQRLSGLRWLVRAAILVAAVFVCRQHSAWGQEKSAPAGKAVEVLFSAEEFDKGFDKHWHFHTAENGTARSATWKVQKGQKPDEDVLICLGKPFGYIRTKELYENYEFSLEWKYPQDKDGNSGILIHTSDEDRIWPKSIQVQLHTPTAGSIFPIKPATTANRVDAKGHCKPVNQWNTCVITCRKGTIGVVINGQKSGEVTGCLPSKGAIALQSEGSAIHFRRIQLRKLD